MNNNNGYWTVYIMDNKINVHVIAHPVNGAVAL